jgi:glutamine synthetase
VRPTLIETTRIFRESKLARDWFGDDSSIITRRPANGMAVRLDAITDWEMKRYFEII